MRGHAPSIVRSGPDPDTGDMTIKVDGPSGVRSEARHTKSGDLSLEVHGAAGIGQGNLFVRRIDSVNDLSCGTPAGWGFRSSYAIR